MHHSGAWQGYKLVIMLDAAAIRFAEMTYDTIDLVHLNPLHGGAAERTTDSALCLHLRAFAVHCACSLEVAAQWPSRKASVAISCAARRPSRAAAAAFRGACACVCVCL